MQCLGTETQTLVDGPKERTQFSCTEGGSGRNWSVAGGSMVSLHMPGAEPTLSIISAPSVRDRSRASSSGSSRLFWSVHGCPVMSWNCRDPGDSPWRIVHGCSFLMEKAMAPHSSTLAWKIPWTEKPGRLQFMGSLRVGHDWMTSLSLFTFTFHFHALEKEMATHSSVLAWRIPGAEEPGGLLSMGSYRVRHDWSDLAAAAALSSVEHSSPAYIHCSIEWDPGSSISTTREQTLPFNRADSHRMKRSPHPVQALVTAIRNTSLIKRTVSSTLWRRCRRYPYQKQPSHQKHWTIHSGSLPHKSSPSNSQ